jgi:hypothetical protein
MVLYSKFRVRNVLSRGVLTRAIRLLSPEARSSMWSFVCTYLRWPINSILFFACKSNSSSTFANWDY